MNNILLLTAITLLTNSTARLEYKLPSAEEAIYGLGDNDVRQLNMRGWEGDLRPRNVGDGLPVVVGVSGWGIYVDDPAVFHFREKDGVITFENTAGKGFKYYLIKSDSIDGVVGEIRKISGQVKKMPKWYYGFWQSKERYQSQAEIVGVVKKYRELGIPLTGIVQDWQYWGGDNTWNAMEFLNPAFPDPKQMVEDIHAMDCKLALSIWQSFGPDTKAYKDFAARGLLLPFITWPKHSGARLINNYLEEARELYFQYLENLIALGVDAWWMDSTDPDHFEKPEDWNYEVLPGETWRMQRGNYPVNAVSGVCERLERKYPDREFFIYTRGAGLGQQKFRCAVWGGDVASSWEVLDKQIPAGINYSLTGNPHWNCDLGGFFAAWGAPKGAPKRSVESEEWRELYVRWMQLGTFLPMMRSHGCQVPREIYLYGKAGEPVYDALVNAVKLRYELMDYILKTEKWVVEEGGSFMRPLAADFPEDRETWSIYREFLFGRDLLVSPVLERGAKTWRTYLPKGAKWQCAKTGKVFDGGQWIEYPVDISSQPYFKRK